MERLEEGQKLERSILWRLTESFYEESAQHAWSASAAQKIDPAAMAVPFYMTSNPVIAARWAQLVFHYYEASLDRFGSSQEPLYIFEMGAGTGRFAALFLRHFFSLLAAHQKRLSQRGETTRKVRYVLCDLSCEVIAQWKKHPDFAPYFQRKLLSCAQLRIEGDHLKEGIVLDDGTKLGSSQLSQGAVFLSGYLYDTLCHSAFWVSAEEKGELLFHVDVPSRKESSKEHSNEQSLVHPLQQLSHARIDYQRSKKIDQPLQLEAGVFKSELEELCKSYQGQLKLQGGQRVLDFSIPLGALRLLESLGLLCQEGGCLVLSGDQGYSDFDQLLDEKRLTFGRHGTISLPVNYDALARMERMKGSEVLVSSSARHKFVECIVLKAPSPKQGEEVSSSEALFREALRDKLQRELECFDVENYWKLIELLHEAGLLLVSQGAQKSSSLSLQGNIELCYLALKLGRGDPINFFFWMPMMEQGLGELSQADKRRWEGLLIEVASQLFLVEEQELDLVLNAGALCVRYQMLTAAKRFFEKGASFAPERGDFCFNLGICALQQGEKEVAAAHFLRAEQLDPRMSLEARGLLKPTA